MYNQLGWHALSSIIVYHFHSLAAPQGEAPLVQALSLQATSHADLWMQGSLLASMKTLKHPAMPSALFHSHNILFFSINGSSYLQPAGLTCIEIHACLSFPQFDCNSATGLAAGPARNNAVLWMQGSLIALMETCTHPAIPDEACHNHKMLMFPRYSSSHLQVRRGQSFSWVHSSSTVFFNTWLMTAF